MDATSMSLYWVARLPIKRPKNWRRSVLAEAGVPVYDADAVSPAAPIGRSRQWKIALSLAVVGALAAPFAFGTYKERIVSPVWVVPLTAKDKEERAYYLKTNDCIASFDAFTDERSNCTYFALRNEAEIFEGRVKEELERGRRLGWQPDPVGYLAVNIAAAALTAGILIVLAYLIPLLIRGVAFLARRYWRWLST
jgi:hypothetical protein